MKELITPSPDFLDRLRFRRQFLIGPELYSPNRYWKNAKLKHGLHLSIHEDLPFKSFENKKFQVTLIGIAVDCTNPHKTVDEITTSLLEQCQDISGVIYASKPLAGRWVIVFQNENNTFIFTDPCGLRQVHYYSAGNHFFWCASQPTLFSQVEKLSETSDESVLNYFYSSELKEKESPWFGNKTIYENCFHLMPNHYLRFNGQQLEQVRYFPSKALKVSKKISSCAKSCSVYLKNIMTGLTNHYNLRMGLTSGFDSRMLLSGSADLINKIDFFVDDLGRLKGYHDDIWVPKRLSEKFNLSLSVEPTPNEVPDWFCEILASNVTLARVSPAIPKVKSIYAQLMNIGPDILFINGNATEIVRVTEQRLRREKFNDFATDEDKISALVNYAGVTFEYPVNEIKEWFDSIQPELVEEAHLWDLYYWEQRMGNWGGLHPAEIDIANDQVSPFNCRLLLETCLKVPRKKRMTPDYVFFVDVIKELWPELLTEPINPGPRGLGLIKKKIRKTIPESLLRILRKVI